MRVYFLLGMMMGLALTGCGRGPRNAHVRLKIDGTAGLLIEMAVANIEQASHERFMHVPADEAEMQLTITWDYTLKDGTLAQATHNGTYLTCDIGVSPVIKPGSVYTEDDFLQVITHEIGHCFGLDHDEKDPNQIMSTYFNRDLYAKNPRAMARYIRDLTAARGL